MDSSKAGSRNGDRSGQNNTEQDGPSVNPERGCLSVLCSHILVGPGSQDLTNLTCANSVYLLFLLWFALATSSLYIPFVRNTLQEELGECARSQRENLDSPCTGFVTTESISLRIGFTLSTTFFTLSLLTIKASGLLKSIHQGYWIAKFTFILFLLSVSLLIPVGNFDLTWNIISFVGTMFFRFFLTVITLDIATSASDIFVAKITIERSKLWYLAWLVCVWFIYLAALVLVVVFYNTLINDCGPSAVLVTTVIVFCILATILTVEHGNNRTGLLHSGIVTLFVLLLSLVTLQHKGICQEEKSPLEDQQAIMITKFLDLLLGFLTMAYAGLRRYNSKHYRYGGAMISCQLEAQTNDENETNIETGECSSLPQLCWFSPGLFFSILGLFSLFMTSRLTELKTSENNEPVLDNATTFCLRSILITSMLTMVIWSQISPILYPSEDPFDVYSVGKTFCCFSIRTCRRLIIDGCEFANGPTASRFINTMLFVLGLSFSCLLYAPAVRRALSTNHYFCASASSLGNCLTTDPAYMAVYRICFAMATFYLLFAVTLLCVENTIDPRTDLQYKAWPVKLCLFFSLLFCSFFLPKEFSRVWIYVALVGTFLFTILQLAMLIYWTKYTSKRLEEKVESSVSGFWPVLMMTSTIFMFFLCLGAIVSFYIFFSHLPWCSTNAVFISLNLVLAIVASGISVHPKIYDAGLFQCFVIVAFSLYLTWSGLSHNPEERCNPVAGYVAEVDMRPNLNIQAAVDLLFTVITVVYFSHKVPTISEHLRELYERIRRRKTSAQVPVMAESQSTDDLNSSVYNFSFFHLVYFIASLHATMILTNWYIPSQGSRFKLSVNWAAMCVKMTASSLSLVIYIWCITVQLVTN